MSVLGNIVSAIFPSRHTPGGTAAAGPSTTTSSPATPSAGLAPAKPISQNDQGELSWQVELKKGDKTQIEFAFTVEYPKDMRVAGL